MNAIAPVDFAKTGAELERFPARDWVERTIGRYPNISREEIASLRGWFEAASALDVGLVASNADTHAAYLAFRKEHLDRFTPADLLRAAVFVLIFGGSVAAILVMGAS